MIYESLFVNPNGRTSRKQFVPALMVLLAVVAFYAWLVTGRTAQWCLLVMVFPGFILHARRMHDMGRSAWVLLAPTGADGRGFCHMAGARPSRSAAADGVADRRARAVPRVRSLGQHRGRPDRNQSVRGTAGDLIARRRRRRARRAGCGCLPYARFSLPSGFERE